mmetsp:Transcript_21009/g.42382  ORF Transcript_21009/g.42382 Transcript_21009/m.42382 type:complete len:127 (+) Transcript_21009:94-474(+)
MHKELIPPPLCGRDKTIGKGRANGKTYLLGPVLPSHYVLQLALSYGTSANSKKFNIEAKMMGEILNENFCPLLDDIATSLSDPASEVLGSCFSLMSSWLLSISTLSGTNGHGASVLFGKLPPNIFE